MNHKNGDNKQTSDTQINSGHHKTSYYSHNKTISK